MIYGKVISITGYFGELHEFDKHNEYYWKPQKSKEHSFKVEANKNFNFSFFSELIDRSRLTNNFQWDACSLWLHVIAFEIIYSIDGNFVSILFKIFTYFVELEILSESIWCNETGNMGKHQQFRYHDGDDIRAIIIHIK